MKTIRIIALLVILSCNLMPGKSWAQAAQNTLQSNQKTMVISGTVTDDQNRPVDLATVRLIRLPENAGQDKTDPGSEESLVSSIYSEIDGSYSFRSLPEGIYRIEVSAIGHSSGSSEPISIHHENAASKTVNIQLQTRENRLDAVTIAVQRPMVERKPDMLVVNVENSALAAGNSALDILERSPGVTLDKDENISLMGKQGVVVMIDGKQTHLSSSQLADLLRNTDGNSIRSIELITTPSSKYDASGSAGIINIVLKKNRMAGTTGSATLAAGYGWKHKSNASLNLSHKTERFNIFGMLSYTDQKGGQKINISRNVATTGGNTLFDQKANMSRKNNSLNYRTGMDYHTSDRNTLAVQLNGYTTNNDIENDSWTRIGQSAAAADSNLRSFSLAEGNFNSVGVNLNNQFSINEKGRKLVADLDISHFYNNRATNYDNTIFLPSGTKKDESYLSRSSTPTSIGIRIGRLDYTHPISERSSLETGLKYSWIQSDNDMRFDVLQDENWQSDPGRSNHFIYTEQVSAAYASYKNQFGKLGLQAGLRAEYSITDGHSLTISNRVKRDYVDIFPTVYLSYALTDLHQTGLSYSKRVNRPTYQHLNPFSYFLDQYTSEKGNPYLQPEYAHAIDASYSFKSRYHMNVGYRFTDDAIVESMIQDDNAKSTYVTRDNLARQNVYYANFHLPVKIANYWNTSTNINTFYMEFDGKLNNTALQQGQFAYQIRNSNYFNLLPTLTAEASLGYQSPLVYSIYRVHQQWGIDIGLNKSLIQKKGNLKLSVGDLFNTRKQRVSTQHSNLDVLVNQKNETRVIRLSFTYNFGNMKNRMQQRESSTEEKNRIAIP